MAFKLLIHSDTTDGSTTFTDSSPDARTITAYEEVQHDTAYAKFGNSSILFTSTSDVLTISVPAISGSWTFDLWIKATTGILSVRWGDANTEFDVYLACSVSNTMLYGYIDGVYRNFAIGTGAFSNFTHFAIVQSGTSMLFFRDGVLKKTLTSCQPAPATSTFRIGGAGTFVYNIDEIAIRDEAVWTADFTPPTAPYGETAKKPLIYGGKRPAQFGGLLMRN